MSRKILKGLDIREYEHEFDRRALEALEATPGLPQLIRAFNKYWNDKLFQIQITGSFLKVTEENFPEVHKALHESCEILNIDRIPQIYIQWGMDINAFIGGVENPIIVLNSGCIDRLSYDEILYIIGHELGHLKSEHILYTQVARSLPHLGKIIGSMTLGIGNLLSTGLEVAILNWARMAEFTADRAGVLCSQNLDAATTAIIKCAGLPQKHNNEANIEAFKNQAREFESFDYDSLSKTAKVFSTMYKSHPWSVMRASELYNWSDSGRYDEILNRGRFSEEKHIILCSECGAKMRILKGLGEVTVRCPSCKKEFSAVS